MSLFENRELMKRLSPNNKRLSMSNFRAHKRSHQSSQIGGSSDNTTAANQQMNTTAMTSSDAGGVSKGVFSTRKNTHAESLYRVTQSSNLLGIP